MFDESPNSLALLDYFNRKYGQLVSPVGLLKACSAVSSQLRDWKWPRLNLFVVAPPRQFKTQTSNEIEAMFPSFTFHTGSDFTMHWLGAETKGDVDKKCIMVNDGTLLFKSKAPRTKSRLWGGLAELLADTKYSYGDWRTSFTIEGRCSCIINITPASYERNESAIEDSTFLDRFMVVFYNMPLKEQIERSRHEPVVKQADRIILKYGKIVNLDEYKPYMEPFISDFSAYSGRAYFGQADAVRALVCSHAILNDRFYLCNDDIEILNMTRDYLNNPMRPNRRKIIEFGRQGRSIKDICLLLGKAPDDYKGYASRILKDARNEGLL